jgi:protein-tyrosine phosphatase
MKILMVCLGNICRSPLAEGIMKEKIKRLGLPWQVDSAGTGSWHVGELPDRRSIHTAIQQGIDIADQRARHFVASDLDNFDLILAMDEQNYQDILRQASGQDQRNKVAMIMDFVHPGEKISVPDPYWNDSGFELVFTMLEKACEGVVQRFTLPPQ